MTALSNRYNTSFLVESDYVAIATTTTTITLPEGPFNHYQAAVQFYVDTDGVKAADYPTAATATFSVFPGVLPSGIAADTGVALTGGAVTVTATANGVVTWSGYATSARVVLSAVTAGTVTHYKIRVYGSES